MIFIFGGSHQGKLDFAKRRFALPDGDVFLCDDETEALDFTRRCVAYIERWALNRVRAGVDPLAALKDGPPIAPDRILIATDISCGVVPVDATMRAWREACGRLNARLAGQSDEVWRLFCGIPQRIK